MKKASLYYWPYVLHPVRALNAKSTSADREGFLIRTADGGVGCVHPWPELGDHTVRDEWRALSEGTPLILGKRALVCAEADGKGRRKGISLWRSDLPVPRSHATLPGELPDGELLSLHEAGFRCGKVKGNRDIPKLAEKLARWRRLLPEWRWRLDFNGVLTEQEWKAAWPVIREACGNRLDFCEDPVPWNPSFWESCEKEGMPLALDRFSEEEETSCRDAYRPNIRVWKPAVQAEDRLQAEQVVVTSYMDHPVGIAWAAREAARVKAEGRFYMNDCGLMTQALYSSTDFSEALGPLSPDFHAPAGTGLGFDDILNRLDWKRF